MSVSDEEIMVKIYLHVHKYIRPIRDDKICRYVELEMTKVQMYIDKNVRPIRDDEIVKKVYIR